MNTKRIRFNRQWVATLLLASLILALAAGLARTGADASGSTVQPAHMAPGCLYSLHPGQTGLSAIEVVCPGADLGKGEGGLPSESQLRSVKGAASGGVVNDGR